MGAELPRQLQPVLAGQAHVEQHHRDRLAVENPPHSTAVIGDEHRVALGREISLEPRTGHRVVIDDENFDGCIFHRLDLELPARAGIFEQDDETRHGSTAAP